MAPAYCRRTRRFVTNLDRNGIAHRAPGGHDYRRTAWHEVDGDAHLGLRTGPRVNRYPDSLDGNEAPTGPKYRAACRIDRVGAEIPAADLKHAAGGVGDGAVDNGS